MINEADKLSAIEALRFTNDRTLDYVREQIDVFSQQLNIDNVYDALPKPQSISDDLSQFFKDLREGKLPNPDNDAENEDVHQEYVDETIKETKKGSKIDKRKGSNYEHEEKAKIKKSRQPTPDTSIIDHRSLNTTTDSLKKTGTSTKSTVKQSDSSASKSKETNSRILSRNPSRPDISKLDDSMKNLSDKKAVNRQQPQATTSKPTKATRTPAKKEDKDVDDQNLDTDRSKVSKSSKGAADNAKATGSFVKSTHKTATVTTANRTDKSPMGRTKSKSSLSQPPSPKSATVKKAPARETRSRTPVARTKPDEETDKTSSTKKPVKRSVTPVNDRRGKDSEKIGGPSRASKEESKRVDSLKAKAPAKDEKKNDTSDSSRSGRKTQETRTPARSPARDVSSSKKEKAAATTVAATKKSDDSGTPQFSKVKDARLVETKVAPVIRTDGATVVKKKRKNSVETFGKQEGDVTSFRDPHNSTLHADERWEKGLLSLDSKDIEQGEDLLANLDRIADDSQLKDSKEYHRGEEDFKRRIRTIVEEPNPDKEVSSPIKRIKTFSTTSSSKKRQLELDIEQIEKDALEGWEKSDSQKARDEDDALMNGEYDPNESDKHHSCEIKDEDPKAIINENQENDEEDDDDDVNGNGGVIPAHTVVNEEDDDDDVNGPSDVNKNIKEDEDDDDDVNDPNPPVINQAAQIEEDDEDDVNGVNINHKVDNSDKVDDPDKKEDEDDVNGPGEAIINATNNINNHKEEDDDDVNGLAQNQQSALNLEPKLDDTEGTSMGADKNIDSNAKTVENEEDDEDVNGPEPTQISKIFADSHAPKSNENADANVNITGHKEVAINKESDTNHVHANLSKSPKGELNNAPDTIDAERDNLESTASLAKNDTAEYQGNESASQKDNNQEVQAEEEKKANDKLDSEQNHAQQVEQPVSVVTPTKTINDDSLRVKLSDQTSEDASDLDKTPKGDSETTPSPDKKKVFVVPKFKSSKTTGVKLVTKKSTEN